MSTAYLQCISETCGRRQDPKRDLHACASCGDLLEVKYEFDPFDPEKLRHTWHQRRLSGDPIDRSGVGRFRELIPFVEPGYRLISLSEGSTPLVGTRRTGWWAGPVHLTIKHQGNNPTGSFVKRHELERITSLCAQRNLAIVSDEVFADYAFAPDPARVM